MDKNEILDTLIQYFSDKPQFDTVLLFGSFASGKENSNSDVDIAVHSDKILQLDERLDMLLDLSKILHREVDLVDLRQCRGVFLHEIMSNNYRIRYDHDTYHDYFLKSLMFMEDEYPTIHWLQQEKIRRFLGESCNAG